MSRLCGASRVTSRPPISTVPSVASSIPATRRSKSVCSDGRREDDGQAEDPPDAVLALEQGGDHRRLLGELGH